MFDVLDIVVFVVTTMCVVAILLNGGFSNF